MPDVLHRVTFEVEDRCIFHVRTECLAQPGEWCRTGCAVPTCEDWGHEEEGCAHCQDLCDCDCVIHGSAAGRCGPLGEPCECATRVEHAHGNDCPHAFRPLDECWLLPWAQADDCWFSEAADVRALVNQQIVKGRDEHPPETWSVVMRGVEGERDEWWAPVDPDPATLRQEAPDAV